MHTRHLRPTPAPSRSVAPFHRGPSAQPLSTAAAVSHGALPNAPNAAMLIDFDNVTMGIQKDLQAELKTLLSSDIIKGKVAVRRAYADWRRYPSYVVPLTEASIDLIFAPAYGTAKKNATDIRLAIDAMELVFTRPEIGTFVLLSGDSDFSSMVIKLKEYGKYVIGVGIRESASDLLVMNCDEYYSYNALAGLVKTGEDETTRWDPWQLVTEAITRMKRDNDVMRSDRLKQVMQDIDSSFDEKDLGMSKFSRFVLEAAHKGLLRTTKLENGQLEVDVPLHAGTNAVASAPTPLPDAETAVEAVRRERPERDDRRGRRGRRGRSSGRDREPREGEEAADTDEITSEFPIVEAVATAPVTTAPVAAAPVIPQRVVSPVAQFKPSFTPTVTAPVVASPPAPVVAAPVTPPVPSISFGDSANDTIGRGGERLTRMEAFDLVRRAVEALVSGEETTTASAVRQSAFEILGRDSESLSGRNFERILRDSHDADMIDLRRRGNDFEVARAADAAPIVEQLKTADDAHKAQAAANAPPAPPRGMSHRGVGGRNKSGRAGASTMSPDMLLMGVVGTPRAPSAAPAATPPDAPATPEPAAPSAPASIESEQPVSKSVRSNTATADTPRTDAPRTDTPRTETPPVERTKASAKTGRAPAKRAAPKTAPVVETKVAAKKAGGAPKTASRKAAKTVRK